MSSWLVAEQAIKPWLDTAYRFHYFARH